ncbi:ABC transporter G family member 20-like isoform X2 [Daktulosphaira vitifoliae]|uniref:ABC transporter G family member 20-like isoform X2 n=1 Tax=Daktulosphaira vitifoliae TaxID=58002 RepID=UPI0021AAFFF9|nr:ABC transporter G family member 20-like isoform X2 [Daktulosphaira vitifoliae]
MVESTSNIARIDDIVTVTNAYKAYSAKKWVLKGLNMKVLRGTIYGLLGSSGCGKSTLLHCILKTSDLDAGKINIYVDKMTNIGYMPQDLCLEKELTIKETLDYYGKLYNVNKDNLLKKIYELNDFLKLPNSNKCIKNLSEGQSRRVSLAISLLHDPKLILLDEPTVGIDPVLRNEIWNKFEEMVHEQSITIIITTHYIEEANLANRVGLMRNGILIEEDSPNVIIQKYDIESLEAAFLKLCNNQDLNNDSEPDVSIQPCYTVYKKDNLPTSESGGSLFRIKELVKKNTRVCFRNPMTLFNLIIVPILQILFLCLCVGTNFKNMPIVYKNDEVALSNCRNLQCIFDETSNEMLSCNVLNHLESLEYNLINVNNLENGEISLNKPNHMAFLYFPPKYTETMKKYLKNKIEYDTKSMVSAHFTNENFLFRNQIIKDVLRIINSEIEGTISRCNINPKIGKLPVEINVLFGKDVKYLINSLVVFFIVLSVHHFSCIFSSSFLLSQKIEGILYRSTFAGVTQFEMLSSLFFMNTVYISILLCIMMFIIYGIFLNPLQITSGLWMYFIIVILLGCIGFFFGLIAAGIMTERIGAFYLVIGWSFMQFTLSGGVWPIEGQPIYLKCISKLLPLNIAGKTMNNIALKGWTITHPEIIFVGVRSSRRPSYEPPLITIN